MRVEIRRLSSFAQEALQATHAVMCPERKQRIDRYVHREDWLRSLAGECLAREMLGAFTGMDPYRIRILETDTGKPVVSLSGVHFSISHSEQLIVCAVNHLPVGIDAEHIRPISRAVVQMACNAWEAEYVLHGVPHDCRELTGDSLLRFFSIWTAKEACAKLTGEGMNAPKGIDSFQLVDQVVSFMYEDCMISVLSADDPMKEIQDSRLTRS